MANEENLMILRLLQEGRITAEQAAALLQAVDPVAPAGSPESMEPAAPDATSGLSGSGAVDEVQSEAVARARARIAAARERVAGVQEKLAAAEERIEAAESSSNPLAGLSEALRDVPGVRSVVDALKGIDPSRIAADARRQARRLGKSVRESLEALPSEWGRFGGIGEPVLRETREVVSPVADGDTVRIRNPFGSIEVVGAQVSEVRVAATVLLYALEADSARTVADEVSIEATPGPDGPSVVVHAPPASKRVVVELKAFVPAAGARVSALSGSADVAVRGVAGGVVAVTSTGDIDCAELVGDVAAETASGDIRLQGIQGGVVARTVSGDIASVRLEGASVGLSTRSGDLRVDASRVDHLAAVTVSGDISLNAASGGTFELRTVSGDVSISGAGSWRSGAVESVSGAVDAALLPLPEVRFAIETVSGDARLVVPPSLQGTVEIRSRTGSVRGELPGVGRIERSGESAALREVVGGGGECIVHVSTLSGDIELASGAEGATLPDAEASGE